MAVEDDEGGPASGLLKDLERVCDPIDVVGVGDAQHVPPVGQEPGGDILGEREVGAALDGDVVVVEDPAEVIEAQVAGERCRLGADAFHQAAVAADGVDVVVEHLEAWFVVAIGEPPLGDGHADAGRDALAQRAGSRLHTRDQSVLRMPGSLASKLTEVADVVERDRRLAEPLVVRIHGSRSREVQHRPQQHRGMAIRQHEAIAIGPDRILGIEVHDAIPEGVDQGRERHRRSRMSRVGRLDCIHRQRPNGVDGELGHLRVGDGGCGHRDAFRRSGAYVARSPRNDVGRVHTPYREPKSRKPS